MRLIQITVKDNTLLQIDNLQARVGAPSRSDAIRRAIELTDVVTRALEQGSRVIIHTRSGRQLQISVPGINGVCDYFV